ncbi:Nitrite reductase (cytochrome; ammonia-forming) [Bacteroides coprosuis DSM 18011]|uniref:nitrite reductase (cytochrome; ammonia-forming) n=1 Tax=Bacteroides coprosuis DSM 18011 TaxID=679937 RepID=F3ZTR6_9BACE|nr:ammonia-forming cytochrome c nitrite reductase [Bacteroides coprosuis]EGJ71297.1 Nitrite reductase (cytochrome; ammonia-forming) [Bacteroides coprosuis DSM 18011]
MFKKLGEQIRKRPAIGWMIFAVVMVAVFLLGLLAASITERRAEIATLFNNKKIEIEGIEPKSDLWGINYPREYETWLKTKDMDFTSKHMGNTPHDVLEERPAMVVMWAGYAFSRDYSAPRGHMHAIEDVRNTLRTGTPENGEGDMQPGTCWTCKGPDVPRLMHEKGIENFYKAKWSDWGAEVMNPVGCADCHDPQNMGLKITRPALIEAFERRGMDITKATQQEMRTLVCAQCHVEYHFKGDTKYLTFPWDKGLTVEDMEAFYDEAEFTDWTHSLSKAPMLKAQHPDYETFTMGPHYKRGLSCADCHMPYKSEGGIKYSNHQVVSPLKNIANTCQTCHRDTEEDLRLYVYEYQDKALEIRDRIEEVLPQVHIMAKIAWDNGATEAEMATALKLIRQAQWRWDFAVASHGGSFHAPVETQRILAHSLDKSLQAQMELQKVFYSHGIKDFNMPDISSKDKAQEFINLDMKNLKEKKEKWVNTVVPAWLEKAKADGKLTAQL